MKIKETHRKRIGIITTIVSIGIAVGYLFLPPTEANITQGMVRFILLYGHTLCWLVFGSASLLWTLNKPRQLIQLLLYTGLGIYILFIVTLLSSL